MPYSVQVKPSRFGRLSPTEADVSPLVRSITLPRGGRQGTNQLGQRQVEGTFRPTSSASKRIHKYIVCIYIYSHIHKPHIHNYIACLAA